MADHALRLTHASTGAEDVLGSGQFVEAVGAVTTEVTDMRLQRSKATVRVRAERLLGAGSVLDLPAGRHRATLHVGGRRVLDGSVTAERVGDGRLHASPTGPVRRWSVGVADDAADRVVAALEAVDVVSLAAALRRDGGVVSVQTARRGGFGWTDVMMDWWRLSDVVAAALVRVGATLAEPLPRTFSMGVRYQSADAVRVHWTAADVVVGDPAAHFDDDVPSTLPAVTAWELVEAWLDAEQLVMEAAYTPYPGRGITVRVRPGHWPADADALGAARPDLSEPVLAGPYAGASRAFEDFDRATAAGLDDGTTTNDFALRTEDKYGLSRIEDAEGDTVPHGGDPPLAASYAARRYDWRGFGERSGNVTERKLPWAVAGVAGVADPDVPDSTTVNHSDGFIEDVYTGRPAVDVEHKPGGVWVVALDNLGRAVHRRRVAAPVAGDAAERMELWAAELYDRRALSDGDVVEVKVSVPLSLLDAYGVALLDPAQGLRLEGRPYAVRTVERDEAKRGAALTLVRPSGTWAEGSGSGGGGGGGAALRYADPTGYGALGSGLTPTDAGGSGPAFHRATFEWSVPADVFTPERWEIDLSPQPSNADGELQVLSRSGSYLLATEIGDGQIPNPHRGSSVRVRCHWDGQEPSAWLDLTAD